MATESTKTRSKHIRLKNDHGKCQRLYDFLADGLEPLPVSTAFRHDLQLVAEELMANTFNHGYGNDPQACIDLELVIGEHKVGLTLTDSAFAYNPLNASSSDDIDDLSEGGMGLQLIKSLTDEQSYRRDNHQNVFTITKHYNK